MRLVEHYTLKKRIITALWGIPLLIVAVWFDKPLPWFTILLAIWGLLAVFEFYRMVVASKLAPLTYFGLVWTLLFIFSRDSEILYVLEPHFNLDLLTPLLLTSAVVLSLIWLVLRRQKEGAFIGWVWTIAGILYVGWLLSYFVALRGLEDGTNWVFLALFVTFGSDTAAFFIGRALGRHYLVPSISPGKTWEGAIGGIFGAIIVSLFFTLPILFTLPNPLYLQDFSYWQAILLGLLASIFGQLGDLVESLLKRNMGVKNSGKLLPGHGGFLDRIDSIVFAGIVVY
ncbi:MAG: phosphatidate cytidylyltransferase, partial [Chloroflexi bacterium]|nr:phosphatidate cytidylyltransferase [Chloroflexota bacterium]